MADTTPPKTRSPNRLPLLGIVAVVLAVVAAMVWSQRQASVPSVFDPSVDLDSAITASAESGLPVLALATADWCGPCQSLKRGALVNARLVKRLKQTVHPVYLDMTDNDDPDTMELGRLLGIEAFPTLVLLKDGRVVSRVAGAVSAATIEQWLDKAGV